MVDNYFLDNVPKTHKIASTRRVESIPLQKKRKAFFKGALEFGSSFVGNSLVNLGLLEILTKSSWALISAQALLVRISNKPRFVKEFPTKTDLLEIT